MSKALPGRWFGLRPRREIRLDLALAGLLGLATLAVRNISFLFSLPYWTDEAWVAVSTKLPLSQLARVSASTPVGWTFLLRLVVVGGDQRQRIVPLVFAGLTVVAAYVYVRSLPWPTLGLARLAAVVAGTVALLNPSALERNDLKQYTADAFFGLLILWMVSRFESARLDSDRLDSDQLVRRRLVQLAAVVVIGFLFSAISIFVGFIAFAGILLATAISRQWKDARAVTVVGAGTGVGLGVIFLVLYRPGMPPGLNTYWAGYYLPTSQGWSASWRFLQTGLHNLAGYLGMGPVVVPAILGVVGVVTLVRIRRVALAIAMPALLLEMVVLSGARQYPLFDLRTSHFLTTELAVTAAIGFSGLCLLLARILRWLPLLATAAALALFVGNVSGDIQAPNINFPVREDLRTPANYLAAHLRPTDVVVVNTSSNWGFGYYWNQSTPQIQPVTSNLQMFVVVFPDQPNILVATSRDSAAVHEVMARAAAAAARIGPTARIWFIHQHVIASEMTLYQSEAKALGLGDQSVIGGALDLWTRSG